MQISLRRLSPLAVLTVVVSMFAVSCLTDPSGPSYQPGFLALAPSFESSAAGIVDVDSVHVILVRDSDGEVAVDEVVALTTDSDSVDLSFSVPVSGPAETFTLTLQCISPSGEVVFSAGPLEVTATTSSTDNVVAEDVPVTYVGVGSDAASVEILSPQDTLLFGESLSLLAEALDGSGEPIDGTPIKWISHDTAKVVVPNAGAGQIVGNRVRGWVHVEAQLLTGPADTMDIWVDPVPSAMSIFSGSNQTGLIGTELPVAVEVQVTAVDGPVEGVIVDFTTGDGGSFTQVSMTTDSNGYAWTSWTLGQNPGQQTAIATARAYTALQATFTATAVTPQEPTLRFTVQPSNATEGATITPPVLVTAYDDFGVVDTDFAGEIAIAIATNPSNGTLSGTTTVSVNAGVAAFSDLSIDAAGAGYTLAATARNYLTATSNAFTVSGAGQGNQVAWTNANGGDWSNGSNWSTGNPPTATDTAVIVLPGEYMVTLDTDAAVGVLVLGDGSNAQGLTIDGTTLTVNTSLVVQDMATLWVDGVVAGDGNITVNGTLSWTSGTMYGNGVVRVGPAGMMTISSTPIKTLDRRQLINDGFVEWAGGNLVLANAAVIDNDIGAVIEASPNGSISGTGLVYNAGTFEQTGPDPTQVRVSFSNDGTILVSAGYLVFEDDFYHEAGALILGVGTLDISGATINTFDGDIGPGTSPGILSVEGNLTLGSSSTVFIEIDGTTVGSEYDRLDVSGNLTVDGTLDITMGFTPSLGNSFNVLGFGGTVSGSFTAINGQDIGGGQELDPIWETTYLALDVVSATPATGAMINWTGAGDGNSWEDAANWDLGRVPAELDTVYVGLDAAYMVTLASDATVADFTLSNSGNIATQALEIGPGVTLQIDSVGYVAGLGQLWLDGGAFGGAGDVSVAGALHCNGCGMFGTGTTDIMSGASMTIGTGSGNPSVFDGRMVTNDGTLEWAGSSVVLDDGARITNNASMTITADDLMSWGGAGSSPMLVNYGTISRTLTATATTIAVDFASAATGSLQIISGSLVLSGNTSFNDANIEVGDGGSTASLSFAGGLNDIDAQSMVTMGPDGLILFLDGWTSIAGSYDYTGSPTSTTSISGGTVVFGSSSTVVIPNLVVNGGVLSGTGDILVADVFSWTGGSIEDSGTLELNSGATGSIGGTGLQLNGHLIHNQGTIYLNGQGPTLSNGAVITNLPNGTIDFLGEYSLYGAGTLNNSGTIVKSIAGAGPSRIELALFNDDTVDVQAGTLAFNGDFTHAAGALLRGSGTFDFSNTNTLLFEGDVAPGTSPGVLSFIDDAFMGSQSTAWIEIGGLTAGTNYDRATVTGSFAAAGTLNVSLIDGFRPTVGNQFTILTHAGGRSGTFDNIVGLDLGGGIEFDTVWSATSLILEAVAAAPAQIVFAGDSGTASAAAGLFTAESDGANQANTWFTGSLGHERWYPRWSPDRSRVALSYGTSGNSNQLYVLSAAGDEVRAVVGDTSTLRPRWSSDGTHLAFECGPYYGGNDVCVIPDVTAAIPVLPQNDHDYLTDFDLVNWPTGPGSFAWDPLDPDRIAVVRDSTPPTGGEGQSLIYTMRYDGTSRERLTATGILDVGNGPLRIQGPMDWSPDGSQIAFAAEDPGFEINIYVIDSDGTNLTQLTSGVYTSHIAPTYSPDGSQILYGKNTNCSYDVYVINNDGSGERRLTNEGVCDFDFNLFGFDWSPDGTEIVLNGFEIPGNGGSNLLVYTVPSTVDYLSYEDLRVPVGRTSGGAPGMFIQPSWRP